MQNLEKGLLRLILTVLISACGTATVEVAPSMTPTEKPAATLTATLIPLLRPTPSITTTPVWHLEIGEPVEISIMGSSSTLKIVGASESMEERIFREGTITITPIEGYKIIVISYEFNECPPMEYLINPVLVDENGQRYSEGYSNPEADYPIFGDNLIRTADCSHWLFGVPIESRHFTLFVPDRETAGNLTQYYEINLDDILYPPPPPPAPVNCTAEALSGTEVLVSWEAPQGLEGQETFYIMFGWGQSERHYGVDETSAIIRELTPNTEYYFEVLTFDGKESSPPSTCVAVVTTLP